MAFVMHANLQSALATMKWLVAVRAPRAEGAEGVVPQ